MSLYLSSNAVMPTTAAQVPLATGTAIKTHQQLAPPTGLSLRIVKYSVKFDTALTAKATVELIETDVAATVTAHVAAGVMAYDADAVAAMNSGVNASLVTLGTSATGYNASVEGTITAVRYFDYQILPIGATGYEWEWSKDREPCIRPGKFGRIRITTGTTINAYTAILHQE